jgi:SAM-dependent methyltransferase
MAIPKLPAMPTKFVLQDKQYTEPYHHYVSIDPPALHRSLSWGLSYWGYVSRVLELVDGYRPGRIAEIGCGDGKILCEVARRHPRATCDGYDLSSRAIAFASAFGGDTATFQAADFASARDSYDLMLCVETLEHIPDEVIPSFVETMSRKLRPEGRLIVTVPSDVLPVSRKHYRHYNRSLLETQMRGLFDVEQVEYIHDPSPFGYRMIESALINRLFVLNHTALRTALFGLYKQRYRQTTPDKGEHVLAVLRPVRIS